MLMVLVMSWALQRGSATQKDSEGLQFVFGVRLAATVVADLQSLRGQVCAELESPMKLGWLMQNVIKMIMAFVKKK